jgi:transposase
LFVDFAGDTVAVFDAATGEERRAQIFVAVLGASNYTFVSIGVHKLDADSHTRRNRDQHPARRGPFA